MQYSTFALLLPLLAFGQTPPPQDPLQQRGIHVQKVPEQEGRQKLEPKKSSVVVPRGFALLVGIATYPKLAAEDNLKYTENDAELMQRVLIDPSGGNFQPENVRTLIGPQATRAAFRSALEEWLPSVAREGDRVLIYFAGHGFSDGAGKGYLALYDADRERLEATAYPMDRLGDMFRDHIKSTWKVLLTDACHSGLISRDREAVNESISNLSNVLSFTASRSNEVAFEDPELRHGVFTYYVAEALQGQADRDGDGRITADELVDYVRNHVIDHTTRHGQRQTPRENQDFGPDLLLAFNPTHAGNQETLAEGGLVVQANMDEVEFLLDGQSKGLVSRNAPLPLPGIKAGPHTVQGVKKGYDPDGPRQVMVSPGQNTPVSLRIQFARTRKKAAVKLFEDGRKQYDHAKTPEQCRAAAGLFLKALSIEPTYSETALYLGRTYRLLEEEESAIKYYKLAIDLDPDYLEARVSYGVMLTDLGNANEAVQQLLQALDRDPNNDQAYSHLAHAYRVAETYDKAAENSRRAIVINPGNAQAHLWLGDCLRQMNKFQDARREYAEYVRLTDFDPNIYYKTIAYFVLPTFTTRAGSHQLAYKDQRNQGYFGLCACEEKLNNLNVSIQYCRKALSYDPDDPYSYFYLGLANMKKFKLTLRREAGEAARSNFQKVVKLNPDLKEANYARSNLEEIDRVMKELAKRHVAVR